MANLLILKLRVRLSRWWVELYYGTVWGKPAVFSSNTTTFYPPTQSHSKAEKNLGPIARGNWVNFDLGQVKIYVGLVAQWASVFSLSGPYVSQLGKWYPYWRLKLKTARWVTVRLVENTNKFKIQVYICLLPLLLHSPYSSNPVVLLVNLHNFR